MFRLRAADIYRVVHIERTPAYDRNAVASAGLTRRNDTLDSQRVAELTARLARCPDLNTLVDATVVGLAELFGYEHSLLLLLDEEGRRLFTIASHGYDAEGVGSEVTVGEGVIGVAAERCIPVTIGNLRQMGKYSRSVRRSYEDCGEIGPGREIPVPGLPLAASRLAVPAMVLGELAGVLMVESTQPVAFGAADEALLTVVASLAAGAIEAERTRDRAELVPAATRGTRRRVPATPGPASVRFFAVDGSTFIDGDYVIKGVAGRLLWSLLGQYTREGRTEFTNREVRLDPSLELPEFRDNFESRLILLKRRLDEREAPVRIEKAARGRFRLLVDRPLELDVVASPNR